MKDSMEQVMVGVKKEPWEIFPLVPDLEITVGKLTINCHKPILAFRSPVFTSMFEIEMVENITNKLIIDDADEETFVTFLRYLYLPEKKISDDKMTMRMLYTANKYMVRSLLQLFWERSEYFVRVENAIDCAIVASQNELLSPWLGKLVKFMAANFNLIRKQEKFPLLKKEVAFMMDLFDKLTLDTNRGLSRCKTVSGEISFPPGSDPKSTDIAGGWNFTLSQSSGHDHIVLDIRRKEDDPCVGDIDYVHFGTVSIGLDFHDDQGPFFTSAFCYAEDIVRKDIITKEQASKSGHNYEFKLEYCKVMAPGDDELDEEEEEEEEEEDSEDSGDVVLMEDEVHMEEVEEEEDL